MFPFCLSPSTSPSLPSLFRPPALSPRSDALPLHLPSPSPPSPPASPLSDGRRAVTTWVRTPPPAPVTASTRPPPSLHQAPSQPPPGPHQPPPLTAKHRRLQCRRAHTHTPALDNSPSLIPPVSLGSTPPPSACQEVRRPRPSPARPLMPEASSPVQLGHSGPLAGIYDRAALRCLGSHDEHLPRYRAAVQPAPTCSQWGLKDGGRHV